MSEEINEKEQVVEDVVENNDEQQPNSKKKKIILWSSIGGAILALVVVLIVILSGNGGYTPYEFAVGDGSKENPYQVSTKEDLVGLQQEVLNTNNTYNKYYSLQNDIDLAGADWAPIGDYDSVFLGTFLGNNYTISNFKITAKESYVGFFASVWRDLNGTEFVSVKDLNISGAEVVVKNLEVANLNVGVLTGNCNGIIENCNIDGKIKIENSKINSVGIIVGSTSNNIINCVSSGEIYMSNPEYNIWRDSAMWPQLGGIAGSINGNIKNCTNRAVFNHVAVATDESNKDITYHNGGIVGNVYQANAQILNCKNEANLTTIGACGGIVGTTSAKGVIIENCLNTGNIFAKSEVCCDVGGILSRSWSNATVINNCKNEGDLSFESKGRWWNGPIVEGASSSASFLAGWIGGISGAGNNHITACVNTGDITASGECVHYLGGIAGGSDGNIKNCYSTGNITGTSKYNNVMCAGIVGVVEGNLSNGNVTIQNNFSTGLVLNNGRALYDAGAAVAYDFVGGCFAYIHTTDNTLKNNYYATNPVGEVLTDYETPTAWYSSEEDHATSPNFVGNAGLTLETMKNGVAFEGFGLYVDETDRAQNINNVWVFENGEFPKLYWED